MNKERVLILADHIEKLTSGSYFQGKYFYMTEFGEPEVKFDEEKFEYACGTPACIAGHAIALFANQEQLKALHDASHEINDGFQDAQGIAEEVLDIQQDSGIASKLFCAVPMSKQGIQLYSPTTKQAAATLRKLAETGEVFWNYNNRY